VQTYRAVKTRLDAYSPLGYSCAGVVSEVAPDVRGFSPGDKVACGGVGYANHSEIVASPVNLCVRLAADADLDKAAYNTLGAIALQGLRQADLRLGETCVVIGLGLLGQLTCLLARASGLKVAGVDIDLRMVDLAAEHCADLAMPADAPALEAKINELTGGIGVDAAIITAASNSNDPVNLAGRAARQRGRVVVVGNVPTDFDRDPYYRKELDLRLSCSYGPGRYDVNYEERGLDYPVGYVRWTENRNMKAFQELLHAGHVDIDYLTTHRFPIDDAPDAYEMILEREEPFLGILIQYPDTKDVPVRRVPAVTYAPKRELNASFFGAGSYAMNNLLPNLRDKRVSLRGVITRTGATARAAADRCGFAFCGTNPEDVWNDADTDTVFVASRHDSHAEYVLHALRRGMNVFVEKPLCLTEEELDNISKSMENAAETRGPPMLMIGFNRRFSPLTSLVKKHLGEGPMAMTYRINAGAMPKDAWMQLAEIGGGRIIGEACHFIDYLVFLNGSLPVDVYATVMEEPNHLEDVVQISLRFANGSIGNISYLSNGSSAVAKEYVEVFGAGTTAILRDFKSVEIHGRRGSTRKKLLLQDKGQSEMMRQFLSALLDGGSAPIPFCEIRSVMQATFRAVESLRQRRVLPVSGVA
jgi:polar amino acid transport system substrate-binding protein